MKVELNKYSVCFMPKVLKAKREKAEKVENQQKMEKFEEQNVCPFWLLL